jgi:hypothetical protein
MKLLLVLNRGLDKVGKAIGQLTVLLLVFLLVGAPAAAAIIFSTAPAFYMVGLAVVDPIVSPILFMVLWSAGCAYVGFYIAPYVQPQIGKAIAALLDRPA